MAEAASIFATKSEIMRRCKNVRLIPFMDAKMAFDCGTGTMYREQLVLLFQMIAKVHRDVAEKMVASAEELRFDLLDLHKRDFMKGALEQGYSVIHSAREWYRLAYQASYVRLSVANDYIKEKYALMSKIYDSMLANPDITDDEIDKLMVASEDRWIKQWESEIGTLRMIARNIRIDED